MKILAHLPLYPPSSLVGAWISTHQCLLGLHARGHEVEVSTYLAGMGWPYELEGIPVHPHRPLDLDGVDVVVSHLGDRQEASRAAKAAGVPSVRMVHGVPVAGQVLDDDLAVFNSCSLAELVGWPGEQIVVPPPIWPSDYHTIPGDRVTLVNLTANKGGYLFWKIAERMPHVQFLAVRGGYGGQIVRRLPNVEVVGASPDIAADVYSRTRVLLMPSKQETYGRTALEAACSGIPTIANPTPGLVESLGDAASFVPVAHIDGWVTEIERLLAPSEWESASKRAKARADLLDPEGDVSRFCDAVEALVKVAA